MDKEAAVHGYDGILLSYKKEYIWVSANEVDEPRAYYTEWSRSEREKLILYVNPYMKNLERYHWWTYCQGSNGNADTENRLTDMGGEGEGEGGTNGESSVEAYTLRVSMKNFSRVWLCDPTDCSPPGSSVRGILLPRILEWVVMPFPRGSPQPKDQTHIS